MDHGALILFMFLGASISAAVASSKNRNVAGWLIAGALFPLISVIAIRCLPPVTIADGSPPAV